IPDASYTTIDDANLAKLKQKIKSSGLTISELVKTSWASASTFRNSDKRGGANGARIRLAPQKDWAVNEPELLSKVLEHYEAIQKSYDGVVSIADLIVLGGSVGIEWAAENAGINVEVPFAAGRADTTQELTDVESFAFLEPMTDGFRNYLGIEVDRPAPENLIDKAQLLNLTAPEMTALIGGMRVLDTTVGMKQLGLFTDTPEALTNDYFVNLLSMETKWTVSERCSHFYEGKDSNGEVKWYATSVDLVFGSNSQLRGIAEVYASVDGKERFITDFVSAWVKVMNADRFDL
ncbi:catalase-peroxidase, partial [Akkermansiaceae bacterium]|nr:catalase-peroxidase [Akkermansiaceae bacterium]